MKVLLTGAFGNVGMSALAELLRQGHTVRCFDLRTKANEKVARRFGNRIEVIWGDLRRPEDVAQAVEGQDVVVHLAFIIPKLSATGIESESQPDLAYQVNVGGTRNLLDALKAQPRPPRLIFASSVHVFGPTQDRTPPLRATDPVCPVEHYSHHKVLCEQMIRESGLEWAILRFGAVFPLSIRPDPGMFDVPLNNRMEFVHTRDVGLAIANAISSSEVWGKVLLIGGGPRCWYYFKDMVSRILEAMGIGMLPEEAFSTTPFCTDWMDTTESQRILQYQQRDLDDFVRDMKAVLGFRRHLIRLFRPFIRQWLLQQSPYYRKAHRPITGWEGKVAVITGASGGIGSAIARRLAQEGVRVVLVARNRKRLENLAAEIHRAGGEARVIVADLTDERERERVVREAWAAYGQVDVLVNSAGLGWYGFGTEMPWSLAREMIHLNITAVVHTTLLMLKEMKARNSGHIINVSSIAGSLPVQGIALYSATKSFVDSFTTSLYRELRETKVRVSVVRPGAVATEFFTRASAQPGGMPMPGRGLAIRPEAVAERVWRLLRRPTRVAHVPRVLGIIPWLEVSMGWLMDRIGPALLRVQLRRASQPASG